MSQVTTIKNYIRLKPYNCTVWFITYEVMIYNNNTEKEKIKLNWSNDMTSDSNLNPEENFKSYK